jgi:(1->4)-alpha-D-glucan 1-alpha-D-glucosylmutase
LRRAHPEWFVDAPYRPLPVRGPAAAHAVGFLRGEDVAVVVPRLPLGLESRGGWEDTVITLPDREWWDELGEVGWSGGSIRVDELLGRFPVALLHSDVSTTPGGGAR